MSVNLPASFVVQTQESLPKELCDDLLSSLNENPNVSIRINRSKGIIPDDFRGGVLNCAIPHCEDGFLLDSRPLFTADPAFHAGAYYVQEANSMVVGELVKRLLVHFDPGAVVLDLCKWGQGNHVVTSADAKLLGELRGLFQIVVADMPCSGEGMFRKTPDAIAEWSLENVLLCASRQQRIAHDIWPSLAEGGVMIYSTCTYNRQENEDNINHIVEELGAEIMEFDFPETLGIVEIEPGKYRMLPSKTLGEGFFFAVLRKTSREKLRLPKVAKMKSAKGLPFFLNDEFMGYDLQDGLMVVRAGDWHDYYPNLPALLPGVKQTGVNAGQSNKNQWKVHPEYDLLAQKTMAYQQIEINIHQALEYYKRAFLPVIIDQKGVVGLRWNGLSLGTANAVNNGLNNLWPMHWRVIQNQMQADSLLVNKLQSP